MAYNTKAIKTDKDGNPISQYYNPNTDEYEPVQGAGGGNKVILYNEDGTPNNSLSLQEILDKLDQLKGTVIDEETRKQNEQIRQQNEQQRIDLYNALKDLDVSQYELRLQKLEHDTSVEEFILEEAYGPIISLPSNATNGQINEIKIFGNTAETEEDNVKSTFGAFRLKSIGKNLFKPFKNKESFSKNVAGFQATSIFTFENNKIIAKYGGSGFHNIRFKLIGLKPNTSYTLSFKSTPFNGSVYRILRVQRSYNPNGYSITLISSELGEIDFGVNNPEFSLIYFITGNTTDTIEFYDFQLEEGNQATEYEDYKESTLYIIGREEEGNILELRSLPNGTKDEVNISERKLIKRIEVKSNITSGTIINFTDMAEGGTYFAWNDNGETETGTKGDTLGIDATTLIYQLANPIEIPIEVFGNLQSYKNGTVYVDTIVPRVDFYTPDGIYFEEPPEKEPRIKEIDSLYLVNKENGLLTPLDISKAFIFPDGRGFTHPDLFTGALVDWDYIPDVESTRGSLSIVLPTNLKASVTSTLQGVQELSNKTKNLNTRVIANRRDIEILNESLFSNVMHLSTGIDSLGLSLNEHEGKSVIDSGGVHGLEIESGTFTPYLYGANVAGSHTYARQIGYYCRIGKLVHIDITIQIDAGNLDTNMSGGLRIGGLPFVNAAGTNRNVGLAKGRISNFKYDNYEEILCFIPTKNNYIQIVGARNGQTLFSITVSDLGAIDTIIEVSGTYEIA